MANILKKLNINGAEYNIGYSQNDLTDELKAKYDAMEQNAINAGKVTISEEAGTGNILKTYKFSQNGAEIGSINLAKDLVVSGGEIVEKDGVKYLSLTIANQENPVEIAVTDLVDVYTGSTYINITNGNVVEVKFADLATALAAEGNAVGNKMKANAEAAAAAQGAEQLAGGIIGAAHRLIAPIQGPYPHFIAAIGLQLAGKAPVLANLTFTGRQYFRFPLVRIGGIALQAIGCIAFVGVHAVVIRFLYPKGIGRIGEAAGSIGQECGRLRKEARIVQRDQVQGAGG